MNARNSSSVVQKLIIPLLLFHGMESYSNIDEEREAKPENAKFLRDCLGTGMQCRIYLSRQKRARNPNASFEDMMRFLKLRAKYEGGKS